MHTLPFSQENDATLHSFPVHRLKQRRKWLWASQTSSEGKEITCQKTLLWQITQCLPQFKRSEINLNKKYQHVTAF